MLVVLSYSLDKSTFIQGKNLCQLLNLLELFRTFTLIINKLFYIHYCYWDRSKVYVPGALFRRYIFTFMSVSAFRGLYQRVGIFRRER